LLVRVICVVSGLIRVVIVRSMLCCIVSLLFVFVVILKFRIILFVVVLKVRVFVKLFVVSSVILFVMFGDFCNCFNWLEEYCYYY